MGRRDKNDERWQECKRKVFELDKGQCLLCQCLTIKEAKIFAENLSGFSTTKIDPAHYRPVSQNIELMYDPNNVFSLCRSMHEALDHGRDPVTNKYCTPDVTEQYWQRIIAKRKENLNQTETHLPEFFDGEKSEPVDPDCNKDIKDLLFYDDL